jgi:preprotein translocase subunit SecD
MRLRPAVLALVAWLVATACVAPNPVPSNCWVGIHGEYRLQAADGSDPGQAALDDAGRILHDRISRVGFAVFEVRTRSDGVIEVDLPPMSDTADVHRLIVAVGDLAFVPIPGGVDIGPGDPVPSDLVPLFGRDAIASATPTVSAGGQAAIDIVLVPAAATTLSEWSGANIGHQLAIGLDGVVITAPVIQARLTNGEFQLSGLADQVEAQRIVTLLSIHRLPGALEELNFGPVSPPAGCSARSS